MFIRSLPTGGDNVLNSIFVAKAAVQRQRAYGDAMLKKNFIFEINVARVMPTGVAIPATNPSPRKPNSQRVMSRLSVASRAPL